MDMPMLKKWLEKVFMKKKRGKFSAPSKKLLKFQKECDQAVIRSRKISRSEKLKFGGNPLPWEPGGEEYFNKIPANQ
jgi:hypothetical protein